MEQRGPRVNDRIRIREVRVIVEDTGEQLGILPTEIALQTARDRGLDLVEVAPEARPPVCKIMDYGKYKYALKQKQKASAKKQHKVVTKEIRVRPKTSPHDLEVKLKHAREFLEKDMKVQVSVLFRGRERAHGDIAKSQLDKIAKGLEDVAKMEMTPKNEGFRMMMILTKK
jgi:translation initiation factor IF-3